MTIKAEIGGKKRPLKFTYGVTRKTCSDLECSFAELETFPEKKAEDFNNYIVTLNYHALIAGAKSEKQDTTEITKEAVQDWLDEMTAEEFTKFQALQIPDTKKK